MNTLKFNFFYFLQLGSLHEHFFYLSNRLNFLLNLKKTRTKCIQGVDKFLGLVYNKLKYKMIRFAFTMQKTWCKWCIKFDYQRSKGKHIHAFLEFSKKINILSASFLEKTKKMVKLLMRKTINLCYALDLEENKKNIHRLR